MPNWIPAFAGMTLLLAGCGFQLRGEPAVGIRDLHVSTLGASQTAAEIRRALAAGGAGAAPSVEASRVHLRILQEARDKNVHTITGTGRVYEYRLRLAVRYEMVAPGRELPLISPTEIEARRLITYSETAPIAKEAEEQLLFKDMQVELAERILRQVVIAQREL